MNDPALPWEVSDRKVRPLLRRLLILGLLAGMAASPGQGVLAASDSCPPNTLASIRRKTEWELHRRIAQASFQANAKAWYETANQIREMYAPDHSVYVGLGRSPTPLIAMLQELHVRQAVNFPFSLEGIRNRMEPQAVILFRENYEGFAAMSRQIFPDPKQLEGKTLVVIDYVSFGQNLFTGGLLLRNELQSRGFSSKVALVSLSDTPGSPNYLTEQLAKLKEPLEHKILLSTEDAALSNYHYFSEYPQFVPGVTPIEKIQTRSQYNEMRQMARDWLLKFGKKSDQESVSIGTTDGN